MNKKCKVCNNIVFFVEDSFSLAIEWDNTKPQQLPFNPKDSNNTKVNTYAAPCPIYVNSDVIKQRKDGSSLYWAMQHSDSSGGIYFSEYCVKSLCGSFNPTYYWMVIYTYFGLLHGVCINGIEYAGDGTLEEVCYGPSIRLNCVLQLIVLCDFLHDTDTLKLLLDTLCKPVHINLPTKQQKACFDVFSRLNIHEWPQLFEICKKLVSYKHTVLDVTSCGVITALLNNYQKESCELFLMVLKNAELATYKSELFGCYNTDQEQLLQSCFLDVTPNLWNNLLKCSRYSILDLHDFDEIDIEESLIQRQELKLQESLALCNKLLDYFWNCVFPDLPKHIEERLILSGSSIIMCFIQFSQEGIIDCISKYFHESDLDVYAVGDKSESVVKYVTHYLKRKHPHTWVKKRTQLLYDSGVTCKIVTLVLPRHPLFTKRSYNVQLIYYSGGCTPITAHQIATHHHFDPVRAFYDPIRRVVVAAPSALMSWCSHCIFELRDKRKSIVDAAAALMKYISRKFSVVIKRDAIVRASAESAAFATTLREVKGLLPPPILDRLIFGDQGGAEQLHALLQLHQSGFFKTMSDTESNCQSTFISDYFNYDAMQTRLKESYNNFYTNYQMLLDDEAFTY